MKIIVCGCGKIGSAIIEKLSEEGHDVIVIDKEQAVVTEIANIHDVMGVVGNCADCETLEDAGVAEAELFIAVTGSDEMNMLSCFLAKRMGAGATSITSSIRRHTPPSRPAAAAHRGKAPWQS